MGPGGEVSRQDQGANAKAAGGGEGAASMPAVPVDAKLVVELPTLSSRKSKPTYTNLSVEDKAKVDEIASKYDFSDPLKVMSFGQAQAEDAATVAATLAEKTAVMDAGQISEISTELKRTYEELGIGDIEMSRFQKALRLVPFVGKKLADPLRDFVDRHESMKERINSLFAAQSGEELKLRGLVETLRAIIEENQTSHRNLQMAIAAAEKALEEQEKKARAMAEEYRGTTDPAQIRQLKNAITVLKVLDHRILTLRVASAEAVNSMTIMDTQVDALVALVGMVNNSKSVMKQAWFNQMAIAVTNYRAKGTAAMLRTNREFMDRIIQANAEDLGAVLTEIHKEMGAGVVSVPVLQAVAEKTIKLQNDILAATTQARQDMKKKSEEVHAVETRMRDAANNSDAVIRAILADSKSA